MKNLKTTRRKASAFIVAGAIACAGLAGSYAALSMTITDGADTHRIYTTDVVEFNVIYTSDSGVITANLDLDAAPTTETIRMQNVGGIAAHGGFFVDRASLPVGFDFDNPILDETTATVAIPTESGTPVVWTGTLAELLTIGFVTDLVVDAGEIVEVPITLTPGTSMAWTSEDPAGVIFATFGTKAFYNQITGGDATNGFTSDLYTLATANGVEIVPGSGVYTLPQNMIAAQFTGDPTPPVGP